MTTPGSVRAYPEFPCLSTVFIEPSFSMDKTIPPKAILPPACPVPAPETVTDIFFSLASLRIEDISSAFWGSTTFSANPPFRWDESSRYDSIIEESFFTIIKTHMGTGLFLKNCPHLMFFIFST